MKNSAFESWSEMAFVMAALAAMAAAPCGAQPRLLFTDITSGPGSGGQDNLGAFVAIYGEGFGAGQGASTVTIGGQSVARVMVWGENNAPARGLDLVVVQVGPAAVSGSIVITVQGQSSNGLPFTVRGGNIYFVTQAGGSDGNPGSYNQPWATLWRPRQSVQPGDLVYVRGGTFSQFDPDYPGWDALLMIEGSTSPSGTPAAPIAYVGYPAEPPLLANAAARRGVLISQDSGPMSHYVIANLELAQSDAPVGLTGIGQRVVGNDLHDGAPGDSGALGVNGDTSATAIFGNLLEHNGVAGNKLCHAIYLGGFGANLDVELGWNEVRNQQGGRGIQVYGHQNGDLVDDLRIHGNRITGSELNGILLGGTDAATEILGAVQVWNNVVAGNGEDGVRVNDPSGSVAIRHNTVHDNAFSQVFLEEAGTGRVALEDNLLLATAGQGYYAFQAGQSDPTSFVAAANLVWGAGACPAWDPGCVNQDPLLANPTGGDYHPLPASPAIDAGVTTTIAVDHDGVKRPQGPGHDIGAYEYGSGGVTAPAAYLVGEGLGAPNPNRVRVFDGNGAATAVDFLAYAAGQWGVNVGTGAIDPTVGDEILTGPGPGAVFGPQARGFSAAGVAMGKVNFYAYGTLRFGLNVTGVAVDGDAFDEIVTGPGPGAVFGPHVRAFDVDGGGVSVIAKINYFAYGTLKYGLNVAGGDVDGDGYGEIVTAPGPGAIFGPQVRGWNFDGGAIASIAKINFNAFATTQFGANVAGGDVDTDGYGEMACAPGPGAGVGFQGRFVGFDYDGTAVGALPGFDVTAFTTGYGGRVGLGSVPRDGRDDLVGGAGRDPAADATVRAFRYGGAALTPYAPFIAFPTVTYGVNATAGKL